MHGYKTETVRLGCFVQTQVFERLVSHSLLSIDEIILGADFRHAGTNNKDRNVRRQTFQNRLAKPLLLPWATLRRFHVSSSTREGWYPRNNGLRSPEERRKAALPFLEVIEQLRAGP